MSDDTEQGNNTLHHSHVYGHSTRHVHALWLVWVFSRTSSNEQAISGYLKPLICLNGNNTNAEALEG